MCPGPVHRLPRRSLPLVVVLLASGASALPAQRAAAGGGPAARQLGAPEVEHEEPFSNVVGVRELADGRVIVADLREKRVALLDLRTGREQAIGREGKGPDEFTTPRALVPLPGDSTLLYDAGSGSYLRIDPQGRLAGRWTPDEAEPAGGGMARMMALMRRVTGPGGVDGAGRLYDLRRPAPVPGRPGADSAPIVRHDRRTGRTDTVAYLRTTGTTTRSSERTSGELVLRPPPFVASDAWAVAPDGRVAIVHVATYTVEWVQPDGRRVRGPATPYVPVRVGEREKAEWLGTQRRSASRMSTPGGPIPPVRVAEPESWPATKPPFLPEAMVAPDGRLWVPLSRAAGDVRPRYDVFDARGALVDRVVLPPNTRLLGFGRGTVYLARVDEDDLQYLQRHRL